MDVAPSIIQRGVFGHSFFFKEIIIHNKAVVQTGVTARVMHPPISQSLHQSASSRCASPSQAIGCRVGLRASSHHTSVLQSTPSASPLAEARRSRHAGSRLVSTVPRARRTDMDPEARLGSHHSEDQLGIGSRQRQQARGPLSPLQYPEQQWPASSRKQLGVEMQKEHRGRIARHLHQPAHGALDRRARVPSCGVHARSTTGGHGQRAWGHSHRRRRQQHAPTPPNDRRRAHDRSDRSAAAAAAAAATTAGSMRARGGLLLT
eukprot:SAG25_NODE_923_length_4749_cov_2.689032_5_plen_262_part_00